MRLADDSLCGSSGGSISEWTAGRLCRFSIAVDSVGRYMSRLKQSTRPFMQSLAAGGFVCIVEVLLFKLSLHYSISLLRLITISKLKDFSPYRIERSY